MAKVMSIQGKLGFKVHFVIQKETLFLNHATVLKVRPSACMVLVPGHVSRFRPAGSAPKGEGAAPKGRKRKGGCRGPDAEQKGVWDGRRHASNRL